LYDARLLRQLLIFVLLLAATTELFAWGEKGHYIANEAATVGLPADMPIFFHKSYPELIYLAYDPDRWRGGGESIDAVNPPDHFLDYEYVSHLEPPRDRYKFITLLNSSGTLRRYGISITAPGFLPWHIAELTELLTTQFRLWRDAAPGSPERDFIEHQAIMVAGVLGHFASDAANPHHASINFNGWVLPNPHHYPYDCETHERFETRFVSHALALEDVTARLSAPQLRKDYFATSLEFIRGSNALVETLYRIDRDGGFDVFRPVSPEAKAFTANRLAAGASLLRDLWWSAWRNSAPAD
jgi:hypothetical protein